MELTKTLAAFIEESQFDLLPDEIVRTAKERLLDTVGAMIAGRESWVYDNQAIAAMAMLGKGNARMIGNDKRAIWPMPVAAMMNATFAHAIELDDGHKFAGVHAGAVVIPTALAVGAELQSSGADVLNAIVVGYETVYRLAAAFSPHLIGKGFHPSATMDTIGAMAVAGKLLNLNREQLANGLGMAALQASGLMEATVSGQQSKCMLVGSAAMKGIVCAYLARENIEGTTTAFEGETGLFRAMGEGVCIEDVVCDLGKKYVISDTYNKFYPTCRHSQPAIEGAITLATEHNIDPRDVKKVEVGTHQVAYNLTGRIHKPENAGEAKFSIAYGVAVAITDRCFGARHLKAETFRDERYLNLSELVETTVAEDVHALYPAKRGARIRVILHNGSAYETECYDLKGSPQNPVGYEDLVVKFRACVDGTLEPEHAAELISRCERFDAEQSVCGFVDLLNW